MTDSPIEEDRRQVSDDLLIYALDDAVLFLRICDPFETGCVSSAINSLWKVVPRSLCGKQSRESAKSIEMLEQAGSGLIGAGTRCVEALNRL